MYISPPFVVSRADADDINGKVHACMHLAPWIIHSLVAVMTKSAHRAIMHLLQTRNNDMLKPSHSPAAFLFHRQ